MTFPPADEPSQQQQRRAAIYGRANQASAHYRPLRKGRPVPDSTPLPGPSSRAGRRGSRRRFVLFVVALVVALALGTTVFGVVLANPAPLAQAPQGPTREVPEPAIQPPPSTGRGAPAERVPPVGGKSGSPPEISTTAPGANPTTAAAQVGASAPTSASAAPQTTTTVYYQNCNKARQAGAAPLYPGDPGYSAKLDKDGNGIACDEKEKKERG